MKRVVILHGLGASPQSHWFDWLAGQARAAGTHVVVPQLPGRDAPEPGAWKAAARAAFGEPNDDLIVVGHSLGTVTALRALAHEHPVRIGGLVLVAPFIDPLPNLPSVDAFTDDLPDVRHVLVDTPITLIASDDDQVVAPTYSTRLAEELGVPLNVVPGGGHFLDSEGFTSLPAARDAVLAAMDR